MKLKSLFTYLLITCTSFTHAGSEEPANKIHPELPQSSNEMLLNPCFPNGKKASSTLVYPGEDGRLVYKPYTEKGDQILDFSICGFKRSEEPIPNVPVVVHLNPLPGETIHDGTMAYPKGIDSREHIQNALDKVASHRPDKGGFRGAVFLEKGTYHVNGSLLVPSGVVLRGEGDEPDGTVLIFRNPKGTGIYIGNPEAEPLSMGAPTRIVDDYIPAGGIHVNVDDAGQFRPGDYIHVRKTTNDKWIKDLGMDRITEIDPENKRVGNWNARSYQLDHVRQITKIEGNKITLDVQLPQSIITEHGGGIVEKISLDGIDSLCGVESLRVVSNYDSSVQSIDDNNNVYFSDEKNNLTSGIDLACINGWVRDCTVKHARNAAVKTMDPARYCTVRDCKSLEPVAPILGGRRYPFSFNGGSHSLFYKCYTKDARHAFAAGSRVLGPNAFLYCTAWRSTTISEPHHRWCTGLLYDNITLKEGGTLGALNRGYSGSGHGWAGANIVFWNCNAEAVVVFDPPTPEQNFAIGYTGEIRDEYPTERLEYANDRSGYAGTPKAGIYEGFSLMGTGYIENPDGPVTPESLFMQQLIDRIGKERAALVMNATEQDYNGLLPKETEVKEIMALVCDYELKNTHLADNWQRFILNSWVPSSFYPGLMAQYRVSGDEKYLTMAKLWAEANKYKLAPRFRHADDHLCGSTYLDLYEIEKEDYMISPTKQQFDSILVTNTMSGREDWKWADALFMAPPTWAKLGRITGDRRYYDFLHTQFFDALIPIYDKEDSLFYRDKRYIEERSAHGKKVFWSRGNGWVVAALPRILENLESNDPYRKKYEELLKEMCSRLIELQGDDGMWRASLLDPVEFPMKESSGTAFFCYGMAWGINNGILEKDTFLPAVFNAWEGLCNIVNEYGRVCYVQPGGASPVVFPERYTHAYAVGGFLLAGEQILKLIDNI